MAINNKLVIVTLLLSVCFVATLINAHESLDQSIIERLHKISVKGTEKISCDLCEVGATLLKGYLERNASVEEVVKGATDICIALKIELPDVCEGIMFAYAPIVYGVVLSNDINPEDLCSKLRFCKTKETIMNHYNEMGELSMMTAKTLSVKTPSVDLSHQVPRMPKGFSGNGYILQLTDIHFDPHYVEGSNPNCGKPLCCRDGTGDAGYFGHYLCDIPQRTVKLIFEQILEINKTMPIDVILFTGDNPPHDVWMQNETKQISSTQVIMEMVQQYFPNTIILPTVGNHESWPSDEFILPNKQWLLDTIHEAWTPFLAQDELESVKKSGYYTMLLQPGLRVVSLNSFDADNINFYNLLVHSNMNKPNNQTDWLIDVLAQSEANNEKVMIIGHIPCTLKSGTLDVWCEIYQNIVERYSSVITAQIYGHTHYDQLVLFSDVATHTKPTGMNYVAPSMTTYQNHEPGFRIYEFNYDTNEMVNYYQFHTNLTQANVVGNLTVHLAYSAKEYYGMPDLSVQSWWNLGQQISTNTAQFNNYYRYLVNSPVLKACDANCHKSWACEIYGVTSQLFDKCLGV
ncbi:hypothetical protein SAMD00019534_107160 [Acytostelium subglobosum LB1]|uniref:hypothetical protein n=1 Tax=Acytostelium subglobosum LB1 TaxID=1410327 RepID=UPI0006448B87|nr:hypothetical protein SAMD00019534_107160 [Acytostelium subglobosum LB1]GAM27540.1 hypothetical protein SAMD00019534_107160 [Acytostelium subglobosum LB1]|eukprot:XP_012749605.1 hypothetical protein SAMD00019534_107160 [Acytostelium subglobosum LB1]